MTHMRVRQMRPCGQGRAATLMGRQRSWVPNPCGLAQVSCVPVYEASRVRVRGTCASQDSIARQFGPFRRGFLRLCGGAALRWFSPSELELLVRVCVYVCVSVSACACLYMCVSACACGSGAATVT